MLSNYALGFADLIEEFYPSGALKTEANYNKNGKLEGIAKRYFENGKLQFERNYKNGKREGIAREYFSNGSLKTEMKFKNGKVISKKDYDESGKLIN